MKYAIRKRCGLVRNGLGMPALLFGVLAGGGPWLSAQTPQGFPAKPSAAVSTLPASEPTDSTAQPEAASPAPATASHQVEVDYTDGKLAVEATNASLNEILREVGRKTGIKITGGVAEDRVFGSYGPSAPSVVLDALLEGTGSNILLVDDAKGGSELILTPRHGGVTPPNPNAAQASEAEDNGPGTYVAPVRPFQPPFPNGRGPALPPQELQGNTPDAEDANAPKTPQQIYDQLQQKMQQQIQQQQKQPLIAPQ